MSLEYAQAVADAVLYEGYSLYPYRASSAKNQVRWQFGVLAPRAFAEADGSEAWSSQTECLATVDGPLAGVRLDVRVRFLHVRARTVEARDAGGELVPVPELEVDGRRLISWDEALPRTVDIEDLDLASLAAAERSFEIGVEGAVDGEPVAGAAGEPLGRIVRQAWPVRGRVRVGVAPQAGAVRIRVVVENMTPWDAAVGSTRAEALRRSLVSAHLLITIRGGAFVSLLDPPPWLAPAAAACRNVGTWPVLAGPPGTDDVMLSSPIILYDHPQLAPESPTDLHDGTEIDEIFTLRILTLTDEEKAEARATDDRAREIIDRSEAIPAEVFERLHGAIRSMSPVGAPFWEPEARVPPDVAVVEIGGTPVSHGSRVRLLPSDRGDTMDPFLRGRVARVEGVFESVDDETFVAVTIEDDPAADLNDWYGRFYYFRPAELEPLEPLEATTVAERPA